MLLRYVFPIPRNVGEGLFCKDLYISSPDGKIPTIQQLCDILGKQQRMYMELGHHNNAADCRECLKLIGKLPVLKEGMHSAAVPIGDRKLAVVILTPVNLKEYPTIVSKEKKDDMVGRKEDNSSRQVRRY